MSTVTTTSAGIPRIAAIDLARLVAIIGMMGAHFAPEFTELPGSLVTTLTTGFPSTLFAVVAGVGAAIAADRPLRDGRDREAMGAQIARGLTVALIGAVLVSLPTFVAVVLVPLGVSIMLVAPLLRARSGTIAAIAVGLAVTGPLLVSRLATTMGMTEIGPVQRSLDSVLFTGIYPAITWVVYLMAGMLIGRAVLAAIRAGRSAALGARLALGGVVAVAAATIIDRVYVDAVAAPALVGVYGVPLETALEWLGGSGYGTPHGTGWDAILIAAPHTGTTLDIVRTVGGAAVVIGLLLAAVGDRRVRALPIRTLVAAGGAGLTIYVVHILTTVVLTLAAEAGVLDGWWWNATALAIDLVVLVALGAVLAITGRRGPFEAVIRWAGRTGARISARTRRGL